VELAKRYVTEGADELVFLDITATIEKRKTLTALVERIAVEINIPFTVGGGIENLDDVASIIKAGADKISINSSAVKNPQLISDIASRFGSQCVVIAIDTGFVNNDWFVFINGGKTPTSLKAIDWALRAEQLGAGEILLTSMKTDGTKDGFSTDITDKLVRALNIPLIASGGAGSMEHFRDVFEKTGCSAALAASVFHFGEISIPELKKYLIKENIIVRI
jgi:cyclase